jgi:hypothetical protein
MYFSSGKLTGRLSIVGQLKTIGDSKYRYGEESMKHQQTSRTAALVASLVVLVLISIMGISRTPTQTPEPQGRSARDFREVRDALRRGGLREAAKLRGHYVGEYDAHWDIGLFDMEDLTKNSVAVVAGTVVTKLGGRLRGEGQLIFTDYELIINEAIKGSLTKGNTITVALPGGIIEFDDGTGAELRTPQFEHVKPGDHHVFFLSENLTRPNEYNLTGGPQGLVELMPDGTLKSHGRPTDPIALETKDPKKAATKEAFLRELRKDAEKWPEPGKCCS